MVAEGHELEHQFKAPSLHNVAERAPYTINHPIHLRMDDACLVDGYTIGMETKPIAYRIWGKDYFDRIAARRNN